jgi:hypothetical protein
MNIAFANPTGRTAIAERIAERQRRANRHDELVSLCGRYLADEPFTQAEAKAETLKWFWQH